MKKWVKSASILLVAFTMAVLTQEVQAAEGVGMYRLYNPNSSEHFYTSNVAERNHLVQVGWKYEQGAWLAPSSGEPVYRLYNPNSGDHHYTTDAEEKNHLVKVGWRYENIGWRSGGFMPVYRLYNPNAKNAGSHHYTLSQAEAQQLIRAGWKDEKIGWYAQGNFAPNDYVPIQSNVPPRKVDENITTAGGGEGNNPGSFRYLYSNKGFDTGVDLNQTPLLEFSADMNINGSRGKGDFYGMQFIIAGNGSAAGQIGLDIGFQEGTSADFAQNRIAVKTVNFPAGAGNHGEQFYSVNTQASMNNTAHITVQYFKGTNGEFVVTKLNQQIVGIYKTKLTTPNQYILHAQIEDWKGKPATLALSNIQVKKYGTDVTSAGAVNLHVANKENTAGNHFNLQANSDHWLIHGAY